MRNPFRYSNSSPKVIRLTGVWLSMQPFLDDEDAIPLPDGSPQRAKQGEVN